jgi:hypothetical protein
MPNAGDLIYIFFLAICVWLALNTDDEGGGGKRQRISSPA